MFFATGKLLAQVKERKFYTEFSPNYTFSKININHEKIDIKVKSFPMASFGLGFFQTFKSNFFYDVSLNYHFRNYRSSTIPFGGTTDNGSTTMPLLNANIGITTKHSSKYKLMAGIGGSLGYSLDVDMLFVMKDTGAVVEKSLGTEVTRKRMITSFINVSSGILIYGKKRNYMINVSYSYGFQVPYRIKYTYTEKQNVYYAEVLSRDSFVQLQFKWFLKNRKA
ncbi:MAG: hypothetical protein KF900_08820 [Bacteroidetes bacterium]|nr:hypothetical protein [Bacteroidota bacterium]